ncbi:hypothetical protein ACFRU3_41070 [Streptomyces sp. NPDC056910]|uniref:hypothetical protein n=1 Tax=Streptomyces sp. NPDC056910 TaxID=3345964 RepID=UPI0036904996
MPCPAAGVLEVHDEVLGGLRHPVVEELEAGEQLLTRTFYRYAKGTCMPRTGLSSDAAVERIRAFTAWANQLAMDHDRPHELIPDDPDGHAPARYHPGGGMARPDRITVRDS